jgi:hypothetical protein
MQFPNDDIRLLFLDLLMSFKGIVAQDFRLLIFFMNGPHMDPRDIPIFSNSVSNLKKNLKRTFTRGVRDSADVRSATCSVSADAVSVVAHAQSTVSETIPALLHIAWIVLQNVDKQNGEIQNGKKHNGESQKVE